MKNKTKVLLFLTMFALSTILVTNNQVKPVSGSGGTVSITSPTTAIAWNQTYTIIWIVDADTDYKIFSVQTKDSFWFVLIDLLRINQSCKDKLSSAKEVLFLPFRCVLRTFY